MMGAKVLPARHWWKAFVPEPAPPPPGLPKEYPWYLRPIPINTRAVEEVMVDRLEALEPKPEKWLYSSITADEQSVKYQEIRNAIRTGEVNAAWVAEYQAAYAAFVTDKLTPLWKKAIVMGGETIEDGINITFIRPGSNYAFTQQGKRVQWWLQNRSLARIEGFTAEKMKAARALLAHFTVEDAQSAAEVARYLRPVIGLTEREMQAVLNYRTELLSQGLDLDAVENSGN